MLSKDEILNIVQNELSNTDNSSIDWEAPLDYYLGNPNGREIEGRSQVTSTDVADAIEWIMPQIMKSFTQNNEVVIFDPVHQGDEKQAELESEFVYEVLMKQNDGFIILHQFVKDALLQKNGILKVYYAERTKNKIASFTSLSEMQLQQLLSNPEIDILEKSEYIDEKQTAEKQQALHNQLQQMQMAAQQGQQINPEQVQALQKEAAEPVVLYDVKISVTRKLGKIYIDPVAPEEFRVNSSHNSINLDEARFTAHVTQKTISDIIDDYGISFEEAKELAGDDYSDSAYRFSAQGEHHDADDSEDESQRLVQVSECFMRIDVDEVGIAKLMKITVAGGDTPTDILDQEEIDEMPWISTTAFLMSHKFYGLSLYDRLKEIQDQKTALWRNAFDNVYLQNNQRLGVIENMVEMDDLMINRPGGIVRMKRADAIVPLQTPALSSDVYTLMDRLDLMRAGRAGVDPDGSATPTNIGDRVGSQGVDRLMNAKEELVGLIIRVIAETGIKPLCVKIRDLSIKHIDSVQDFQFRGVWHKINPSQWMDRFKCTVRVGTGTGNQQQKIAALESIMEKQVLLAQAQSPLINEISGFNTLDDFCKFNGLNGAVRYFVDPNSPQGQQAIQVQQQKQQQQQQEQSAIQQQLVAAQNKLAEAEQAKVQATMQNNMAKNQLELQKQTFESQIKQLEQQLSEAKAIADNIGEDADRQLKQYDIDTKAAIELTKIEAELAIQEEQNFQQNRDAINE